MKMTENEGISNREKKNLFPGAKFGLKSLRDEKPLPVSKYYDLTTTVSLGIAVAVFILIPYVHFEVIYTLWSQFTRKVNRTSCTCNCWDTTFKSNYETGIPQYKHVYFNITSNTYKIWIVTVVAILLLYETIRKACHLRMRQQLRHSMLVLFISSIYPHYYSWWAFFNFWNDDYHHQWLHQSLFTLTELMSTFFIVHLFDKHAEPLPWKLLTISSIAVAHSVMALTDQFGYNVIRGEGELHQVLRDVGFMIPDLLNIFIPLRELRLYAKRKYIPVFLLISNKNAFCSFCFVVSTLIFSKFL